MISVLRLLVTLMIVAFAGAASAQPIGTFAWQLQPYCNRVVVTVTASGGVYALDGFDDLCGAPARAPVTGMAVPNPDGTVGIGLAMVSAGGGPLHVAATISLATISGTWRDTRGAGGAFAFNQQSGGSPRPPVAGLTADTLAVAGDGTFLGAIAAGTQFNLGSERVLAVNGPSNLYLGMGGASTTGTANTLVGRRAGMVTTTGRLNTLVGAAAGVTLTTGIENTLVGATPLMGSPDADGNTLVGTYAYAAAGVSNASAFGNRAIAESSNTVVLGQIAGKNGAGETSRVLIGTTDITSSQLTVVGPNLSSIQVGNTATQNASYVFFGPGSNVYLRRAQNQLILGAPNGINLQPGDGEMVGPIFDNANSLGAVGQRWTTVHAVNGVIQTSDRRQKRDIEALRYGLPDLLRLQPVSFRWMQKPDDRRHLGLIAQNVESVVPEVIVRGTTPDDPLGMNYAELVPVLINAIQELERRLSALEAARCHAAAREQKTQAIKELKEKNDALERRLAAIEATLNYKR